MHKWMKIRAVVLGTAIAAGCGDDGSPSGGVSSIVVSPANPTLNTIGETQAFTAQAFDAQSQLLALQPTFAWSSSAPGVAMIDEVTGVATAVDEGTATITASVAEVVGGVEGTTTLSVPRGALSQSEKTALANALASTEFGGLASYVVQIVGSVGTLDAATATAAVNSALADAISFSSTGAMAADYEGAVGIAVEFDYDLQGEVFSGWFYGVFGWNDINASAGTVGEWVIVGASGETGSLPSSTSGDIGTGNIFAEYSMNYALYYGTSGSASLSGSFSGSTDCSQTAQGITVYCSYSIGTMNGNFSFIAEALTGGGSYTQTPITFANLPAVKMTLEITQ